MMREASFMNPAALKRCGVQGGVAQLPVTSDESGAAAAGASVFQILRLAPPAVMIFLPSGLKLAETTQSVNEWRKTRSRVSAVPSSFQSAAVPSRLAVRTEPLGRTTIESIALPCDAAAGTSVLGGCPRES